MKSLAHAGVPSSTIHAVCDRMWLNQARRRQILYTEGNGATHLYAIRKGKVKLSKVDSGGRVHVTALLESGDLFGFEAVFDRTYSTSAEALTDCELCLSSADQMTQLMREVPQVATDLAGYLHRQLATLRERQFVIAAPGAPAKLAGYLLHRLALQHDGGEDTVARDLTLSDLGGILGVSPETVCRALGELKSRRLVESVPLGIRVKNIDGLRLVAGL
ncbi:MAG TPA: Crp/Fnr family transcriptional regulator [Acidobacteriota bacterium]